MRMFETGATRNSSEGKLDYEGFLSPLVLQRFAEYMNKHRLQADGALRDSDNWQKGMPVIEYLKSGLRHMMTWWLSVRSYVSQEETEDALCALLFNVQGFLYETLRTRHYGKENDYPDQSDQELDSWITGDFTWRQNKRWVKEPDGSYSAEFSWGKKVAPEYGVEPAPSSGHPTEVFNTDPTVDGQYFYRWQKDDSTGRMVEERSTWNSEWERTGRSTSAASSP